jgi:putative ABC transport system substrate-binding protein
VYFGTGNTAPDGYASFREGLRQAGWMENENLVIDWHINADAHGVGEWLPALVDESARGRSVVLFTDNPPHGVALKQQTDALPIVVLVGDPVANGLVSNLAHPEGNVTGVSSAPNSMGSKKIEMLEQVLPGATRLGLVYSDQGGPSQTAQLAEAEDAARQLELQLVPVQVHQPEDFGPVFDALANARVNAVYLLQDQVTLNYQRELALFAADRGLPTLCVRSDWVERGCLISYGANRQALYARVASHHIDRLLRGTRPSDLPVELPTVFDLSLNVKTLQALGLTVPQPAQGLVTEWLQ